MVTIEDISLARTQVCITLNTGKTYWIYKQDLEKTGIKTGQQYKTEDFIHLIRISQYPRALNSAVSMLARRPCSRGEIEQKLMQKNYDTETIELVIYKLTKEQLINDEQFCKQWILYRLNQRYGPARIRLELKSKGIPDDMINTAFEYIDAEEKEENAFVLAQKSLKRIKDGGNIYQRRNKVVASLVRRGYDWDTASKAYIKAENELKNNPCPE